MRRNLLLLVTALAGTVAIGVVVNARYALADWLLFRVLGYVALSAYFGLGCFSVGLELLDRIAKRQYRVSEAPFVAFPLGVLAFAIVVFLVGLAGRLGVAFFWLAPLALFLTGYPSFTRFCRRAWAQASGARTFSLVEQGAFVLLAVGLVFVYLPILTPHNVQHDARWYHLTIAQQYAAEGAVRRFPEGWFLGAYPHLASLLYTWGMLAPFGIVHRLQICAHLEFAIFLMTVGAIPAVVRRVLPGVRLPLAGAAFFLFPGFLVYDSNLSVGADHVAAVFAPAGLLALYPALRTLSARHSALVGVFAGAAALTKYSAISVSIPLLGAVVLRAGYLAATGRHRKRAAEAVWALTSAFVVVLSPHWLKNYLWYGDPAYPILHHYFRPHPWTQQAESFFRIFLRLAIMSPTADLAGFLDTLRVSLTLGLTGENYGFHEDFPTFGFLFATTLYCLPFTRPAWRLKVAYALGFAAAVVWFATNHRDRYLQACLPWFVAATVALLHTLWTRSGTLGRVAAGLLVGAQLAAGAGLALLPASFMIPGGHALGPVVELVGAGYRKDAPPRFKPFEEWNFAAWTTLGRSVPRGARVLVHEDRLWLGLDAPVVIDEAAWQGGIAYTYAQSDRDIYDALAPYHVTHLVTGQPHADSGGHGIAADLVFADFVLEHASRVAESGKLTLWKLPAARPPLVPLGPSLILTCNQSQPLGLYRHEQIIHRDPEVPLPSASVPEELLARATFVITEAGCDFPDFSPRLTAFTNMSSRNDVTFWKRATARTGATP